jgi:RNA polymerase sigma factor (sigma-70 family)
VQDRRADSEDARNKNTENLKWKTPHRGTNGKEGPDPRGWRSMTRAAAIETGMASTVSGSESAGGWTDDQLLRQFVSRADPSAEAAFAVLVARYGSVVHRVCRNVLGNSHDAQDAAQAVFLVLARKAQFIRKPRSLGPWLHGVALRVARRAQSTTARQRAAERRNAEMSHELDSRDSGPESVNHSELHEEIDRLPEKYRLPIILFYMQGQTQTQAALTLGWPLGTVQIRLHRGRERLRSRLTRRGASSIALTSAVLTTALAPAPGALGPDWTETTARAAVRFAAGKGTAGLIAPAVSRLAETVVNAMLGGSLRLVALSVISLLLASAGVGLVGLAGGQRRLDVARREPEPAPALVIKAEPASRAASPAPPVQLVVKIDPPADAVIERATKPRSVARSGVSPESSTPLLSRATDRDPSAGPFSRSPPPPGRSLSLAAPSRPSEKTLSTGRELFARSWVKNDQRGHGGDGLGPVFNGRSCVACHNLGGPGGAGAADTNVEIATASDTLGDGAGYFYSFRMDFGAGTFEYRLGSAPNGQSGRRAQADTMLLTGVHPGFRNSNSVVLHRYGTDPAYRAWRESVPGRHGPLLIQTSQRNPPPLFGAGLIDAISDEAIEEAARRASRGSAQSSGRVSRLKDGRVGRFGWKAQTATLAEFVRSAAAGEIGLEIPGLHQAVDPRMPGVAATEFDMDETECDALAEYVRSLPIPVAMKPADEKQSAQWKAGEATFKSIGCTACHLAKLDGVDSFYSDLLLHDMGPELADTESYTVFAGDPPQVGAPAVASRPRAERGAASGREWRTPPLWGLRDSAPYLHDGRAPTIAQAIALHAGQGATAARRYAELSPRRKRQLEAFLLSLAGPSPN